jgi:hypothetical protein
MLFLLLHLLLPPLLLLRLRRQNVLLSCGFCWNRDYWPKVLLQRIRLLPQLLLSLLLLLK